jgi:hypothetical protein
MTPTELLSLISQLEGLAEKAVQERLTTKFIGPAFLDFRLSADPDVFKTLCAELRVRIEREAVLLEALVAAEDQLSRWPYTSEVIKGLYHPNTLIQKIRSALAEQKDTTP